MVVERIEHDGDAGAAMRPEHIAQAEPAVAVFEDEPAPDGIGQRIGGARKAVERGGHVGVSAADVDDDNAGVVQPHAVEQRGRRRQFAAGAADDDRIRMAQLDEETGMQGQADALLSRHVANGGQLGRTFVELCVEGGQVGVRQIGSKLAGHAIETDLPAFQIEKYIAQVGEADAQMRRVLPAAAVVRTQAGRAEHLDGESQTDTRLNRHGG